MKELELLERAKNKRVLFLGEKIIDHYVYVRPLGRPTKDAIVSVEEVDEDVFQGGIVAAKEHAKTFCHVEWQAQGSIITKKRYVEQSHVRKLFETYTYNGSAHKPFPDVTAYDATVVLDYGHGMADRRFLETIESAKYLAINVQTNSGNYGFNLATKYKRCDYLCVDEQEARLATQNRSGPIEESLRALGEIAEKTVVTLGKGGAVGYCDGALSTCNAFTDTVVDTIGSGDAFFSITALVSQEADMQSLLRIGNAAGAIKSQIVGHRGSVNKETLTAYLKKLSAKA